MVVIMKIILDAFLFFAQMAIPTISNNAGTPNAKKMSNNMYQPTAVLSTNNRFITFHSLILPTALFYHLYKINSWFQKV